MKQYVKPILLICLIFFLAPTLSFAGNFYTYFGINAGYQHFNTNNNVCYHNNGLGYHYRVGYRFDNNVGANIGYSGIILGSSLNNQNEGIDADRARTNEYTARLSYLFTSNIYGFLGGGMSITQIDSDWFYGPAFTGGSGLKIPMDEHWSIGGEFSYSYHNVFSEETNDPGELMLNRFVGTIMIGYDF